MNFGAVLTAAGLVVAAVIVIAYRAFYGIDKRVRQHIADVESSAAKRIRDADARAAVEKQRADDAEKDADKERDLRIGMQEQLGEARAINKGMVAELSAVKTRLAAVERRLREVQGHD